MLEQQFTPTLKDLRSKEVKKLSHQLKTNNPIETLINVLEWEEKNIRGWADRWYMYYVFLLLLTCVYLVLPMNQLVKFGIIGIILLIAIYDITSILPWVLITLGYLMVIFTLLFSIGLPPLNKTFTIFHLVGTSFLTGGFTSLIIYLYIKYRGIKTIQPKFKLSDTFKLSLEADKIIKYKLAICRDYAKITGVLLMNLFPDKTCYFVTIPSHVAAGIEFNKKIYILDQRLPIVTIDKWIMVWKLKLKKKKLKANLSKVVKNEKGIKLKKVRKILIDDIKASSPDFEKIEKMVISSLRIKKEATRRKPDLVIPLNLYGVLYNQDRIVETSIVEAITNIIKRELPKNYQRIANIKITKKKYDWNLRIWIKR